MDIHDGKLLFIFFTACLSLLFTFGELVAKEKSSQVYLQACLFFLAGIFQFHTFFIGAQGYLIYPHFYLLHLPFTAFFGSILFRYFSIFWTEGKNTLPFRFIELIPSLLAIVLLFPLYTSSAEEKILLIRQYPDLRVPIQVKIAITIAVTPIFVATVSVFWQLSKFLRWQTLKHSAHLRLVLYVIVLGAFAACIGLWTLYFQKRHGLEIVSCVIGLITILVFLLRQRNPLLVHEINQIVIEEKKYQISQLKSINISELGEKLEHLMTTKKFYRNDEISLGELSQELGVSQHQLSEFLNLHLGKNFFSYLNFYRIQEAKELCLNAPEKTILSIAYEVGFPSKSTFYDAFKRETGMSPTEYRKQKRPNS